MSKILLEKIKDLERKYKDLEYRYDIAVKWSDQVVEIYDTLIERIETIEKEQINMKTPQEFRNRKNFNDMFYDNETRTSEANTKIH